MRVVVVGGTSVGKSTLVNHWTGADAATGLGGVTQTPTTYQAGEVVVIDTPSLDHPWDLHATAAGADLLVWVLDGLRPVGHEAAEQVARIRSVVGGVIGVASRLDLLGDTDRTDVLTRLRRRCPGPVQLCDLRRAPPALPSLDPMVTRRQALLDAIAAHEQRLQEVLDLYEGWRELVRTTPLTATTTARDEFHRSLRRAASILTLSSPPTLPAPAPPPAPSLVGRLGGAAHSERERATRRARWLAEGQVVLTDWLGHGLDHNTARGEQKRLQAWATRMGLIPTVPQT